MGDWEELRDLLRAKSYEKREVILVSGRKSNFYIDARQTTTDPRGVYLAGKLVYERIKESGVEAIGAVPMGANPIATAVSIVSHLEGKPISSFFVRKEPKGHGMGAWIEGMRNLRPGAPVALVEDVLTTGGSTLKAIERIHEEGLNVAKVLILVDRMEGGRENLAEQGYHIDAIFTRFDIAED